MAGKLIERDDTTTVFFDAPDFTDETTDAEAKTSELEGALKTDANSFVTVHRLLSGGNSPEEFCERIPADKMDYGQIQDHIAKVFGGGDYRIRLYAKGRLVSNKLLAIAHHIKADSEKTPAGEAGGILAIVLQKMEAQNRLMMGMLERQNQPQQSRMEMLREMMAMKELFGGGGNNQGGGVQQFLDTIEGLKSLGIKVGGETIEHEKDSGFGELIEKMTPVIAAAMQAPAHPPVQQKSNPEIARKQQMNLMQKIALKTRLEPFIKASIKKSAPETYAEILIDQLGEETATQYASDPATLDQLCAMDQRIADNKAWFNDVMEHAKAQLGLPSLFSDLYDQDENDIDSASPIDGTVTDERPHV